MKKLAFLPYPPDLISTLSKNYPELCFINNGALADESTVVSLEEGEFIASLKKRSFEFVMQADYVSALALSEIVVTSQPESWESIYHYAAVLSDYIKLGSAADSTCEAELLASAQELLALSLRNMKRGTKTYLSARNEFFYSTAQYRKQYLTGKSMGDIKSANYSKGVGASNAARVHACAGEYFKARWYAARAVSYFDSFHQAVDNYYNSYIHYASALFVMGRKRDAQNALDMALSLSKCETEVDEVLGYFSLKDHLIFWCLGLIIPRGSG